MTLWLEVDDHLNYPKVIFLNRLKVLKYYEILDEIITVVNFLIELSKSVRKLLSCQT